MVSFARTHNPTGLDEGFDCIFAANTSQQTHRNSPWPQAIADINERFLYMYLSRDGSSSHTAFMWWRWRRFQLILEAEARDDDAGATQEDIKNARIAGCISSTNQKLAI